MRSDSKQPRANLEQKLQIALTNYMRYAHPDVLYFAVPNGGPRDAIQGSLLKKMGVKAGVADCLFFWVGGMGAIELKRPDKTAYMSDTQVAFRERWEKVGGKFALCNSMPQCEEALALWGLTTRYKTPTLDCSGRQMLQQVVVHEMMRKD